MKPVAALLSALLLMGCPPPEGLVYSASSPDAARLTQERLQPIVERYGFDGEIRVSGGPLEGATMGRGRSWPWASVTKQVVAVMVMQDVEAGRLALDTPVSAYLDSWPADGPQAPSLRQLLRHTSGLYDPEDDGTYVFSDTAALDPMLCVERRTKEPGNSFNYNNCDFLLVGRILEQVNGTSLTELFRMRIAEPARLTNARFATPDMRLVKSSGSLSAATIARFGAAGGLVGTVRDMLLFDEALLGGKLLPETAREEMWDGVPELGYTALGQWESVVPLAGCDEPVRIIERRGAIEGYQARNFIIPERGIALAALIGQSEGVFDFGEPWSREGMSYDLLSAAVCSA